MKKTISDDYRSGRLRRHFSPILVWLGVLACVVGLFRYRTQQFEFVGIVQVQEHRVAATCAGRLKNLNTLRLFEEFEPGQTLAVLDDKQLQAQLATARAEIERLQAELIATRDRLTVETADRENNLITAYRRFSVDVEQNRLRILELKTILEPDRIMLQDLQVEINIVKDLLKEKAVAPYELQKVQVQYNTLEKKIQANQYLLEQAEQNLKQARQRLDEFSRQQPLHASLEDALEPLRKAITVQEQRIEELLVQCRAMILKAPFKGVVSQVLHSPGEAVLPGEPILTIIKDVKPTEIIAYARENQMYLIQEGKTVELIKNSQPPQIAHSLVEKIGPNVEIMPQQLWRNPNICQWGRPILIKIPSGMELSSGELVGIRGL